MTLKKILSKKDVVAIVNDLISFLDVPLAIKDGVDKLLLGTNHAGYSQRYSIKSGDDVIGWVEGTEKTKVVASLLSFAANKELETKVLAQETLFRYKELSFIYSFTTRLIDCIELDDAAVFIANEINRLIHADHVSIMLENRQTAFLEVMASSGKDYFLPTRIARDEGLSGRVFSTGNAEIINNVDLDFTGIDRQKTQCAMMCAPLKTKNGIRGIINIINERSVNYTAGDLKLFTTLTTQAAHAFENAALYADLIESKRVEEALALAHDIQMSMLPKIGPAVIANPKIELHAFISPAKEVGGDFYDFFFTDENTLVFAIGDVSGKGVPAALFMAVTKTLIKAIAKTYNTPAEILNLANKELIQDNDSFMFVTIFIGILNIDTGEMHYSNGGHNLPFIINNTGEINQIATTPGVCLGIAADMKYHSAKIILNKGDCLFLYTDGVTEAMNMKKQQFSEERLYKLLQNSHDICLKQLIEKISTEVSHFTRNTLQSDDITMMAWKMRP